MSKNKERTPQENLSYQCSVDVRSPQKHPKNYIYDVQLFLQSSYSVNENAVQIVSFEIVCCS